MGVVGGPLSPTEKALSEPRFLHCEMTLHKAGGGASERGQLVHGAGTYKRDQDCVNTLRHRWEEGYMRPRPMLLQSKWV